MSCGLLVLTTGLENGRLAFPFRLTYVDHVYECERKDWVVSCRLRPPVKRKSTRSSAPVPFGDRLYEWRKKNDFSQSEAALKLRISRRTLQEWEQGRARPRHLALNALEALIKKSQVADR